MWEERPYQTDYNAAGNDDDDSAHNAPGKPTRCVVKQKNLPNFRPAPVFFRRPPTNSIQSLWHLFCELILCAILAHQERNLGNPINAVLSSHQRPTRS